MYTTQKEGLSLKVSVHVVRKCNSSTGMDQLILKLGTRRCQMVKFLQILKCISFPSTPFTRDTMQEINNNRHLTNRDLLPSHYLFLLEKQKNYECKDNYHHTRVVGTTSHIVLKYTVCGNGVIVAE